VENMKKKEWGRVIIYRLGHVPKIVLVPSSGESVGQVFLAARISTTKWLRIHVNGKRRTRRKKVYPGDKIIIIATLRIG